MTDLRAEFARRISRRRSESQASFGKRILFGLVLLPSLFPVWLLIDHVFKIGVNLPFQDEWVHVDLLRRYWEEEIGAWTFLWTTHNGQPMPFLRGLILVSAWWTDLDFLLMRWLGVAALLATSLMVFHVFLQNNVIHFERPLSALSVWPVSLVLFNLSSWELFTQGSISAHLLSVPFIFGSLIATKKYYEVGRPVWLFVGAIMAFLSALTYGPALVAPVGWAVVVSVFSRGRKELFGGIAFGVAAIAALLFAGTGSPPGQAMILSVDSAAYTVNLLTTPLWNHWHNSRPPVLAATAVGTLVGAAALRTLITGALRREQPESVLPSGLVFMGVVCAAAIWLSRMHLGPVQAFSSRYAGLMIIPLGIVIGANQGFQKTGSRVVSIVLLLCLSTFAAG